VPLIVLTKFNKVSLPSPKDVHMICLISGTTLNCVLVFYTSEYLLFFFSLLVDPVLLTLNRPNDWSWGPSVHNNPHVQWYSQRYYTLSHAILSQCI